MRGVFDKNQIRKWVVYKIVNPEGHVYVGCTCRFRERMWRYKKLGCSKQGRLYESLEKHGFAAHAITILDSFESNHNYSQGKEIFWIRTCMSNYAQWPEMNGLNQTIGGYDSPYLQTKESRKKAQNVMRNSPEIRERRSRNISKAKLGSKKSPETKAKIRETMRKLYSKQDVEFTKVTLPRREFQPQDIKHKIA